jgi:hypothetical protein
MSYLGLGRDMWKVDEDNITTTLLVCYTSALAHISGELTTYAVFLGQRICLLRGDRTC